MSDLIFSIFFPCLFVGVGAAWLSWALGIRRFLKRNGRPYQQSVNIRSGGDGMIQDVIELLEHCRGRCPLPVSFWLFMFGISLALLSVMVGIFVSFAFW